MCGVAAEWADMDEFDGFAVGGAAFDERGAWGRGEHERESGLAGLDGRSGVEEEGEMG